MDIRHFGRVIAFISVPVFAGVDLVKVDKSERKMYLMDEGEIVKTYHISLGGDP